MPDRESSPEHDERNAEGTGEQIGSVRAKAQKSWTGCVKSTFRILYIRLRVKLGLVKHYTPRVVRIGNTVVKWTKYPTTEALSLSFVRNNSSVPVPRVIDVLRQGPWTYTVMEFIDAPPAEDIWKTLSSDQKRDIFLQLHDHLKELRTLSPPHPGKVEAINGSALRDVRMGGFQDEKTRTFGPFSCVDEFHRHFGHDFIRENPEKYKWAQSAFSRILGRKYRTVFTHGDLGLQNVLVRDGKIIAIIDWDFAGWYPEYWEYTRCVYSNFCYKDALEMIKNGDLLDVYEDEEAVEDCLNTAFTRC